MKIIMLEGKNMFVKNALKLSFGVLICFNWSAQNTAVAGELYEMLKQNEDQGARINAAKYRMKAAEQRIEIQKSAYGPLISIDAEELYASEEIKSSSPVFRDGLAKYGNARIRLNIEKPLYDSSIKYKVQAKQKQAQKFGALVRVVQTESKQKILKAYISAGLYGVVNESYKRVITQLGSELNKASIRLDNKLATVSEIENLKVQLLSTERDARLNKVLLQRSLGEIGKKPFKTNQYYLNQNVDLVNFTSLTSGDNTVTAPVLSILSDEIQSLSLEAEGVRREKFPKLNFLGRYEYSDANESIFGGDRRLETYSVGIGLKWELYRRGVMKPRHQALIYEKMAKEAEVKAIKDELKKGSSESEWTLTALYKRAQDAAKLVAHQATIKQSLEKGYNAGTESFAAALDAMLYSEATIREWEKSRHEVLLKYIDFKAQLLEFSDFDLKALDALFVARKA